METASAGFTMAPVLGFSGSAERQAGDGVDVVFSGVAHDGDPRGLRRVDAYQVEEPGAAAQVLDEGGIGPGAGQCRWLHSSLRVSPAAAGGMGRVRVRRS